MQDNKLHIIMPVKDSIEMTERAIRAIVQSGHTLCIYDDNSSKENAQRLDTLAEELDIPVIHIANLTDHPSPNYLLVLQKTQQEAIEADAGLIIVESDVTVQKDTLQKLYEGAMERKDCGMAASVTTDEEGVINFPYLYAKGRRPEVYDEKKRFSFCCTLLTPTFLRAFDFHLLDASKNWFDVTISHESIKKGFHNYLFINLPVLHRPHGSRPWKKLKYTNPLKYYWLKYTKGLDKI